MHGQRNVVSLMILAAIAMPASGQEASPSAAPPADSGTPAALDPKLVSGTWGRYSFPGLASPLLGPGPVVNTARRRQSFDDNGRPFAAAARPPLVSDNTKLVGDYTNPILKPQALKVVKEHGEIELGGWPAPNSTNECQPSGVP